MKPPTQVRVDCPMCGEEVTVSLTWGIGARTEPAPGPSVKGKTFVTLECRTNVPGTHYCRDLP